VEEGLLEDDPAPVEPVDDLDEGADGAEIAALDGVAGEFSAGLSRSSWRWAWSSLVSTTRCSSTCATIWRIRSAERCSAIA
jgi:hypothetical protein